MVRLACADDDARGQALEVYWNHEPDRLILEEEGWQDLAARGFDPPRMFAAFLHTLRWNCVTATGPTLFQAPFRAGIKIDAYQMEPLRKAKTIVVSTLPSVLEQWKAELEERFGLVFEILDRAYLTRMRRERGFGVNS